ncbi:MAG TPA: SDR family NAD(P)-dependent oxidoreductase [Solirubrobacteraceae bacterium]|nr:SDR family NAD(P)-dependent oxidoreductase [Solirubrobacteraceae bacterium]
MSQHIDLSGKIAVVTGAGSGIGRSSARLIARHGARVHLADLNGQAAAAVTAEIEAAGGSAVAHTLDVSDPDAVEALAASVFDAEGFVDVLHNNAGIGHGANVEATTIEDWQRVINVNLLGVAYGVQAFVPRMLAQGRPASVVNTASMAGLVPTAKMAPYCASKFGVVGMSESLNAELSKRGIRVSAICPGIIDTPIVATGIMRGDLAALQKQATSFYSRRGASPDEVAEAVLQTIARPRLIVPVPRRQVTALYLLHRLSPRLVQPIARNFERIVGRG